MTHRFQRGGLLALAVALLMMGPAFAQVPDLPPLPQRLNATVPYQGLTTVFQEDFEAGPAGFTTGGTTSFEHGIPDAPPVPLTGQGPNMWGTNLVGDYGLRECGWVESPPIDLTQVPAGVDADAMIARLSFTHWYDIDTFDGAAVMVSLDGESWDVVSPVDGYPGTAYNSVRKCFGINIRDPAYVGEPASGNDGWRFAEFDLTRYLGNEVLVRWAFASSGLGPARGWYFDDVAVEMGAGVSSTVPVPQVDPQAPFQPLATLYAEDFEADDGAWTVTGTDAWEWGEVQSPPYPTFGGVNAWATTLDGAYPASACSALTSPLITIPGHEQGGVQSARLAFEKWQHLEPLVDGAVLQASTDGGRSWERVTPDGGYDAPLVYGDATTHACLGLAAGESAWTGPYRAPSPDAWESVSVDVTRFMGTDVRFRFVFASDATEEPFGVYVDDVIVEVGVGSSTDALDPSSVAVPAPGWTITGPNPSWEYGYVFDGPRSVTPAWGTNLFGDHNVRECGAIVSPPLVTSAVPGLGRLTLSFEHHMTTQWKTASGIVQVTDDDGATWHTVTPIGGYDTTFATGLSGCVDRSGGPLGGFTGGYTGPGFEAREVRLSEFDGDVIRVRFVFGSAFEYQAPGWYIRGVSLNRGAVDVPFASQADADALVAKADAGLLDAVRQAPDERFEVIVTGPPHEGLTQSAFPDRASAMRALEARSAPFVAAVTAAAEAAGGTVVKSWASAPAVKVVTGLPGLLAIAGVPEARSMSADSPDAVQLVDPIESADVGAENSQGRNMIQAEDLWALGFKGEGMRISIIDTGIDARHEAFKHANGSSRIVGWFDAVNAQPTPYDDHGHGTHVGATAAGSDAFDDPEFGRFQEKGVAPEAELLGAKFLNGGGSGSLEGAIDALEWSFQEGAHVTSNSWGSSCSSASKAVLATVRTLTDLGMVNVFAAGNSGSGARTIGSPGCSESGISVGAVNGAESIATFSSRGECRDPEVNGDWRICPDVVAKGVFVRSAIPRDGAAAADPTGYMTWDGTSMATPHVSGAVALIEQMKRAYTGEGWNTSARQEKEILKLTARDLGPDGADNAYGSGLVQLAAVHAFLDDTGEPRVVSGFGVSNPVLYYGDDTRLHFSVRNLGNTPVTGAFSATLTAPDGTVTPIADRGVTLGILDGESVEDVFTVERDTLMGTYAFNASFAYAWTNESTGEVVEDVITYGDAFDVKRVHVEVAIDGFHAEALPGVPQDVTVSVTNQGNADARSMVLEFTVPDRYAFLPPEGANVTDADARYGSPAPDRVERNDQFGRVTLVYEIGTLPEGDAFSATMRLAPTLPGDYRVVAAVKFVDATGNAFAASTVAAQNVGAHALTVP